MQRMHAATEHGFELPTTEQIQTADECARRTLDICMSKMLLNNRAATSGYILASVSTKQTETSTALYLGARSTAAVVSSPVTLRIASRQLAAQEAEGLALPQKNSEIAIRVYTADKQNLLSPESDMWRTKFSLLGADGSP